VAKQIPPIPMQPSRTARRALVAMLLAIAGTIPAGCLGGGKDSGGSNAGGSINVAIVDTPNLQDLADLTPSLFTDRTDIEVNYTILPEGTLREVTTQHAGTGSRAFDVVMIGPYEAPQFGKDGYLTDLTRRASTATTTWATSSQRCGARCRTRAGSTRHRSMGSRPS
jgi:sorbitol/mannitol transport system substrate-binding protein